MILEVACKDVGFLVRIIAKLLKYLHFLIPIFLVVLIVFDLYKVLVGQADDKSKTEAFNKIVRRLIYAVIIFLIPTIVFYVFKRVDEIKTKDSNSSVSATTWYNCFMEEYKK